MSYIDEYKELRSEIRLYLDQGQKMAQYSFIIVAGVFVAGFEYKDSILFFMTSIIIIILWFNKIRCTMAVIRVASYIEKFIEPFNPELNWETYGRLHSVQKSYLVRFISNFTFPFLIILSTVKGIILLKCSTFLIIIISAVSAIIITALIIYSYQVIKKARENEIKGWSNIETQLKKSNNQ